MKKVKAFYNNNRIFCILMGVSILLIALILVLVMVYFVNQTKSDVYGNRLNGIESVKIDNKRIDEFEKEIKDESIVSDVIINVKGKIIYINVHLNDGKVEDAQNMAIKTLDLLSEDEKEYYDINYAFVKKDDETFPIMGYKKCDSKIISWTRGNGE